MQVFVFYLSFHLDLAAFLAISDRRLALIPSARALPPMRPSATAAAFLPSSVVVCSISPVAIRVTWKALPMTSAGRLSPLGPRGMALIEDRLIFSDLAAQVVYLRLCPTLERPTDMQVAALQPFQHFLRFGQLGFDFHKLPAAFH